MALKTLGDLVSSLAPRGEHDAIVAFGRDEPVQIKFPDVASRVEHRGAGLMGAGVVKGDRVGLLAPNHPNWIIAALAAIRAGATVVPMDVQLPDKTLAHILGDAKPAVLCTVSTQAERIRKIHAAPHTIVLLDEEEVGKAGRNVKPHKGAPGLDGSDIALLFYTSGTTGMPKGVPLSHQNMIHQLNVLAELGIVRHADRLFLPLPLHHVYPFVMGMLLPLSLGARIILPAALTGPQLTKAMRQGKATVIVGVPRLYGALMDGVDRQAAAKGKIPGALLRAAFGLSAFTRKATGLRIGKYLLGSVGRKIGPNVRLAASGGAALPPHVAYRLESLGWNVVAGYGLSETAPLLTLNYPGQSRLTTAGKPIPGVELRIDKPQPKQPEEPAKKGSHAAPEPEEPAANPNANPHEGEVVARGPNVFSGYLNLPEKTKEAFTPDGWFRTGDLGSFDHSGFLHLTGRASTMIVTQGGKHIQPDDVEAVYQKNAAIKEIGILQKEGKLVAIVVPAHADSGKSQEAAIGRAIEEAGRHLRTFERVSEFAITAEPLPKTRMGKVQRFQLAERFDHAKSGKGESKKTGPMPESEMSGEDRELLRDPAAAAVWQWLIERAPRARLTPESSLRLDLNVDSMEWLNLTLEIGKRAGVELDEEAIGRVETVHDLLLEVSLAAKGDGSQLEQALAEPRKAISNEQKSWLKPLSATQAFFSGLLYSLARIVMTVFFRVRADGLENLPAKGNFVIAANHNSYLDPFAIAAVLSNKRLRRINWAGWTGAAFRGPITRTASRLGRTIPIDPRRAIISSLALAAAVLKRGDSLVWFPEGARSEDGKLAELRPGLGILLAHEPTLIVPAHIEGSFEAMPRDARLPRPHRIRITFGEPVESKSLAKEGKNGEPSDRIIEGLTQRLQSLAKSAHREGKRPRKHSVAQHRTAKTPRGNV